MSWDSSQSKIKLQFGHLWKVPDDMVKDLLLQTNDWVSRLVTAIGRCRKPQSVSYVEEFIFAFSPLVSTMPLSSQLSEEEEKVSIVDTYV